MSSRRPSILIALVVLGGGRLAGQGYAIGEVDRYGRGFARARELCADGVRHDRDSLVVRRDRAWDSLDTASPGEAWTEAACASALLFDADSFPFQKVMGIPAVPAAWVQEALRASAAGIARDPARRRALALFAVLANEITSVWYQFRSPAPFEELREGLWPGIVAGTSDAAALRACVSLSLTVSDPATARGCIDRALRAGQDSTWHYLRLAWLDAKRDSAAAARWFEAALEAANTPTMEAEAAALSAYLFNQDRWEARTPGIDPDDIVQEWGRDRMGWVLDHLAAIDDSPVGRLALELRYLEYRGSDFWPCVARTNRTRSVRPEQCFVGDPLPAYRQIHTAARVHRLWDPESGVPVAVTSYRLRDEDLADTTVTGQHPPARLTMRLWSPRDRHLVDSTVTLRLDGSPARGVLTLPAPEGVSSWALNVAQAGQRRGHAFADPEEPLGEGSVTFSDLVLGQARDSLWWTVPGESVPISTTLDFTRGEPLSLYAQVRSDRGRPAARMSMRVSRLRGTEVDPRDALTVESPGGIHGGITAVIREVDLSRLKPGDYVLEIGVVDGDEVLATRRVVFRLVKD